MDEQAQIFWDNCKERICRCNEKINNGTGNKARLMRTLEFCYKSLAMMEIIYNKNIVEARKKYFLASMAREWYYKAYAIGKYNIDSQEVTTYSYESLFYSVLSGNRDWAQHMANLFGSYKELETNEFLANELLGYGLKYVILDDKEQARAYIQRLEESKSKIGMKQYISGYARAYRGIIEHDTEEFNQGILYMLNNHAARMKKNGREFEGLFAYDSVALAMIAKDRGIEIKVEHELLPMNCLEETKVDYSSLKLLEIDEENKFPKMYEKMLERGYFDGQSTNYLWMYEMEWDSTNDILTSFDSDSTEKRIIPFAFTGGGDKWVFIKEKNKVEFAVGIYYECDAETVYFAKDFEDALFRQILEFVSDDNFYISEDEMESYQISEKELKEQLVEWKEKLKDILSDRYLAELEKLTKLNLKCVSDENYQWYALLTGEELNEIKRKYMPYCLA